MPGRVRVLRHRLDVPQRRLRGSPWCESAHWNTSDEDSHPEVRVLSERAFPTSTIMRRR